MHADLKYVESLEDEIDELESVKAEFSNMYDMLLQECMSNDIRCSYLQSSSDLDKITELQCLYLHKVRECDCLAQKLSEQTEFEREQYLEIQDLKAQLQDKNIAISELKKLIEKCKGKSVDTKFDKPSVVRQPNAQRIPKPSVLGKLAPFSDSLERTNFAKKKSVSKTNESEGLSKPVTPQNFPQTATQAVKRQMLLNQDVSNCKLSLSQLRLQINLLSKKDVVIGLPKLKYVKDQLCSCCEVSKAKRSLFKSKTVPCSKGRLNLLHMDLCGPMRVASINGKRYILNGVVERRNCTLVEAARTMLSASKLPLFFWAEAIATACYTQNRSIIIPTHEKTAYHIINDRKPSIKHLHIFGCTCYLTRDGENLDKMKEKGDPCILVGYSTQSKGYRVYNKRTRLIVESIHLRFDEIKEMSETSVANDTSGLVPQRQKASDYDNPDPAPELQNVSPSADTTVPSQQELDLLFGPLYDEFFNDGTSRVNKSSSPTDNYIKKDTLPSTHIQPTSEPTTPTNVHAEEKNDNQAEFTNPFCTPVRILKK
ncbi:retrovirus-related pol polyprotein from transposon TNT 1-94 [Tanacetum coccineum]